ncbi:MAG: choline dehydrogenase [Microlunatus sp.]
MAESYDYIVVGAGTAGCVLASRLSEDPGVRVLLVEAGGSDRHPAITMPGGLPFVYQNKRIGWGIRSGPEPYAHGKTVDEKAGRVLGGSSSINAMIFNRGNPLDFEQWAADGLTDWDFAHVLPYFRAMETFAEGGNEWRGGEGPVHVTRAKAAHQFYDAFLRAGEQAGFEVAEDHNAYRQEGLHIAQSFIDHGVRWSSSKAYLRPAAKRGNLTVWTRRLVTGIVVRDGEARGVTVRERNGKQRTVECEREVIVCAGAMHTPKLLMLSGIGPADELRRHGIPVVAADAGVGANLQNHPGVDIQFGTAHEDSLTSQVGLLQRPRIGLEYLVKRQGLATTNFFETGAFLRTRDDVTHPNMQYEFLPLTRQLRGGKLVPVPGFQFWMDLARPLSRGSVTLRSADPADQPSVVFNHLREHQDLRDLVDGVKLAQELVRQPAWQRYRPEQLNPGADCTSDADLEEFVRRSVGTSYHASGSCRMGADDTSVVDPQGRLRAVGRIRVVDASIMPKVVTGNINAAVMMMAEKIADHVRGRTPLPPSTATFYRASTHNEPQSGGPEL